MCNFGIFPKLLHFGKIPKKFGQHLTKIQQNSAKLWQNFQHFVKNQQTFQQFLTKQLRLENLIPKRCKGVHCVDLGISARAFQRVFSCKIWLRYSRERAFQSLPKISQTLEYKLEKTQARTDTARSCWWIAWKFASSVSQGSSRKLICTWALSR